MKKGAPVKIDVNKELIEAAKQGLVDRVKDLTKDANFNVNFQEETNQQTALHFAAQNGHSALVQFLLTLEADVNIFDADENTALHLACEEGQLPVVDLLINFPLIDLNLKNGDDLTAVSIAIKLKHKEIVSLLTKAGAILPKKADDNLPKVNIFESYQAELQFLPLAFQETVAGVLYSTVLTVVNIVTTNNTITAATEMLSNPAPAVISKLLESAKYKDTLSTNLSKHHTAANINEMYSAEGKFVNLCANNIITTNTMFSALFKEANSQNIVNTFKNDNNVVEFDDFYTVHNHMTAISGTGNNTSNNSININSNKGNSSNASVVSGNSQINNLIMHGSKLGLQLFHKHAIIRLHISRLLTDTIYPNKPSLTLVERSIKETELLHFSVLSAHDLYRANQLQTLYEVLKHHTIPLPNFTKQLLITSNANNSSSNSITSDNNNNSATLTTEVNVMKRRYFRSLNSFNFAQIVNTEYQKEPQVIKHYYPLTDELLYVLHFPPPNRRKNNASWNSTILPVKKVLENSTLDETKVKKSPKKSLKPKKKELEKPLETYNNVSVNTITLTPAGKAIVFIKQIISTVTSIPEEDETDVDNAIATINKTASKDGAEATAHDLTSDGNVGNLPPCVDKNSVQTTKEAWCTIHINNSVLGLRTLPIIIASAEDTSAALPEGEKGGAKSQTSTPIKSNNNNSSNVNSTVQLPGVESVENDENNGVVATTGSFFCHTEDNVRIVACAGPSPVVNKKPDKLGTVCFVVSYLSGLVVNICSNGTYKISPPLCMRINSINNNNGSGNNVISAVTTANNTNNNTALNSYNNSYNSYTSQNNSYTNNIHAIANGPAGSGKVDPLVFEISRTVGVHGTVYRTLALNGPYKYEILFADGTRTLYRNIDYKGDTNNNNNNSNNNKQNNPNTPKARKQSTMARKNSTLQPETHSIYEHFTEFHAELLQNAPEKWSFVNLNVNGSVLFYQGGDGGELLAEGETEKGVPHPTIKSTVQYTIDAETRAEIQTYTDGRMIVTNRDGNKRVIFSDGTTITTHANGTVLYIEKESYPLIEIDDEVDSMCRSHSRGIEVPINKGGERVRSRLALPDGTAVMVKYDTRVTAVTNGSIQLVRRDKTTLLVKDNGVVNYAPRTAWNEKDAANFSSEAQDCEPANSSALPNNSTFRDTPGTAGFSPDHNSITNSITHSITNSVTSGKTTKKPTTTGANSVAVTQNNRNKDSNTLAHMDASNPYNNGNISPRSRNSHPTAGHGAKTKANNNSITIGNKTANKLNKESNNMNKQHEMKEKESHETKFTINFINLTCKIQDYEHNCFDIDLIHNPLEPHINLSGEVEGLKPPAITDNPLEPRCFIVNRAAEATEVVSVQEIIALEDQLRLNPEECFKLTSAAEIQPSDLGPSTLSKYLVRKRLLGSCSDSFQFTEVFGSREWHHVKLPAAASFLLRNTSALNFRRTDTMPAVPKYYQGISVIEHPPLSDGGYAQLTRDIARCEEFRENRVKSIDRFAIEDKRTEADIEEEEAMTKRLKQAYKIAKMQAAQRKQHREKEAAAISMHNAVIPEGNNEDEEEPDNGGDDENSVKFDDEEDEVTDPVELELRATFSDFAEHYADNTANNSYASNINTATNMTAGEYFIPKHNYQDALIRMCNCFISEALIEKSLELCHEFDSHMNELTLSEFRSLHKSVLNQLANPTAEHHIEIDDRDYKISSQYNSQLNSPTKEHHNNNISQFPSVLTTPRDGSYSYRSDHTIDTFGSAGNGHGNGNADKHHDRVKPSSPHYWESPMGKKNITTLPKSAPPLDFRQLEDWSGNKVNNGNPQAFGEILSFDGDSALGEREAFDKESSPEGRGDGGNSVKYAAGSAIHAARQNK